MESGKRADRPPLAAALAFGRTRRAVLVIAKLDRLARNARFLLSVAEGSDEAGVVFCDLPTMLAGPGGKFLVTQMAAVAELEAGLISQRTRAALAVAKSRDVRLGNTLRRRGDRSATRQIGNSGDVPATAAVPPPWSDCRGLPYEAERASGSCCGIGTDHNGAGWCPSALADTGPFARDGRSGGLGH